MTAPPAQPRRVDGSMSLLVDMMRDAQDPAYGDARRRAPAAPAGGDRPRGRAAVGAAVLVVVGLVTGTAIADVRGDSTASARTRDQLAQEVGTRTQESDALAAQVARLRSEVADRRDAALARDTQGRASATLLEGLELASAAVAVTGPGVVVVLDDRPSDQDPAALPRGGEPGDGRVLDRDLQALVNGLWAAGAEAVSVNDLRLTARTAIRSAGEAVLVDFRPISPPYVVRAIGEPGRLEPAFVDGEAGRRLTTFASLYGLRLEVSGEDRLELPAGTVAELRDAQPVPP